MHTRTHHYHQGSFATIGILVTIIINYQAATKLGYVDCIPCNQCFGRVLSATKYAPQQIVGPISSTSIQCKLWAAAELHTLKSCVACLWHQNSHSSWKVVPICAFCQCDVFIGCFAYLLRIKPSETSSNLQITDLLVPHPLSFLGQIVLFETKHGRVHVL